MAARIAFSARSSGRDPSSKVYEDDEILAFHDINPVAPVHFMLIPRSTWYRSHTSRIGTSRCGEMLLLAHRLASEQGSPDGFRAIVNTGRVGRQDVFHVHMHVLGGRDPLPGMIQRSK